MERQLLDRDGRQLIARQVPGPGIGAHSGVTIIDEEEVRKMATKAPHDGVYTLNGARFRAREGEPLPDGAVMDAQRNQGPVPENKAKPAAPQNKAAKPAPEKK